jgi:hypothetical protein
MRPTAEEIAEARAWLRAKEHSAFAGDSGPSTWARIHVLLAATESHTDEEIAQAVVDARIARDHMPASNRDGWLIRIKMQLVNNEDTYATIVRDVLRHFFGPVKP